jgi:ligand-binding sensor domain-containing protein
MVHKTSFKSDHLMKQFSKIGLLFVYLSLLSWQGQSAIAQIEVEKAEMNEKGIPYIKNYAPDDYGSNPMNWGAVRNDRGVLYIANLNGVLEFDGVSWRIIEMPKGSWTLSISKDSTGTIYAGLFGDFGYLAPDLKGQLQFRSLLEHVEPEDRDFTEIWRIHCTKRGIWFRSRNKIFLWSENKIKVFRSDSFYSLTSVLDDTLYVEERGKGLMRTSGDSLILVQDSKRLHPMHFLAILPYDQNHKLICTTKGLLLFDGKIFHPFNSAVNTFLKTNTLSSAVALSAGQYAFGTYQKGACIMDKQGRIVQYLDKSSGLRNEDIKSLYYDSQEILWMLLNSGLAQVSVNSPISFYNERQGLEGNVVSIIRHGQTLYNCNGLIQWNCV